MEIIKSIQVRKFRSLKSVTKKLDLTELNIFVGKNDQGKSNLLRALNLFSIMKRTWTLNLDFLRIIVITPIKGKELVKKLELI
ncbi:AAA family ATPase [Vibrio cholerae]|uniref:AAA family ATPase n=1 Tax=Vibrio cholerae TaxID=666 RepID=UPI001964A5F5|nr:AAA family ATPase [Vibrio cholerae]ELJ8579475.1 AAA family ATPase [Vibrio cholerae]